MTTMFGLRGQHDPISDRLRVTIDRIEQAASAIDPVFLRSSQFEFESQGAEVGCHLTLKIETMNPTRCLKGGANWLVAEAERLGDSHPMVCASAGNFGQATAVSN